MTYMCRAIHYCQKIYLKACTTNISRYTKLTVLGFFSQPCLKKAKTEIELLTDGNMLLILDKGLRVGMYHNIHQYPKANDMYMKDLSKE